MPDYGMPALTRGERVYRAMLRLYPKPFREEFSLDLVETFRDEQKTAVRNGTPLLLFWLGTLRELVVHATGARLSAAFGRASSRSNVGESCFPPLSDLSTEIRIASRALFRRPGFALTIVITLALAIGVNTAAFRVVDAVVLHPLRINDPGSVVAVYKVSRTSPYDPVSLASYSELKARSRTLSRIAAFAVATAELSDGNRIEEINAQFVTEEYFQIVGTRASVGRVLNPGDAVEAGSNEVAVLSHQFWTNKLGADSSIIGRSIKLAGRQVTVVGVTERGFRGTSLSIAPDMYMPVSCISKLALRASAMLGRGDLHSESSLFQIIARFHQGGSADEVADELNSIEKERKASLEREVFGTASAAPILTVVPVNDAAAAVRDRSTLVAYLRLLCSVVGVTLLLACLNVANLMVVRSRERSIELGVRSALGATSIMLARFLLIEALILASVGGTLGVILAVALLKLFASFALPGNIVIGGLDTVAGPRVFLFVAAITLGSALVFGLYPASTGSRRSVQDRFRSSETSARPRLFGRGALLAMQIGIALTLLTGATTFVETLRTGLGSDLGFDSERIAAVSIKPNFDGTRAENAELYESVVRRLADVAGVESAAAASHVPLQSTRTLPFQIGAATPSPVPDAQIVQLPLAIITPNYFRVLGVPIVSGREFSSIDNDGGTRAIIVNESTARQLWPGQSPIAKQLTFLNDITYTVVGVVRDTRYTTVQDSGSMFAYAPMTQEDPRANVTFVVRTQHPRMVLAAMQNTIADAAPQLVTVRPRIVRDQINAALMPQRFGATLLSSFALLALVLSAVGIHGTVAYTVSRRQRELGVRMALGASGASVTGTVLRDVAAATVCGIVLGGAFAAGTQKLLAHFLRNVSAPGFTPFTIATIVLTAIALMASAIPARRATRINPMNVIRPS